MRNLKLKVGLIFILVAVFLFGSLIVANAHFGMIIPSDDMQCTFRDGDPL